jgi:hypothetical protein
MLKAYGIYNYHRTSDGLLLYTEHSNRVLRSLALADYDKETVQFKQPLFKRESQQRYLILTMLSPWAETVYRFPHHENSK